MKGSEGRKFGQVGGALATIARKPPLRAERPVITVFPDCSRNAWLARFEGDAEVLRLFGTDTLPTGYTLLCDGVDVRAALQQRNPGALVRLVERDGSRPHLEDWT